MKVFHGVFVFLSSCDRFERTATVPPLGCLLGGIAGIMPAGGLAELKRRKQEAEKEASEGTEEDNAAAILSPEPVTDQKPGELQHVSSVVFFLLPGKSFEGWFLGLLYKSVAFICGS